MPVPAKAYSYTRFSSPEQARGDSLRRQVAAAEAWANARGLNLDERLTDSGLSAYRGAHRERGALGAFLAAVEAGTIARGSTLIVESLDRLSREDVLSAFDQLRDLVRAGVTIVTLSDGQIYSLETLAADWTRLMLSVAVMARAHEESARKSERVGAAWSQKRVRAASGEAMSAACVAWCRPVGRGAARRYEFIPERAAIVRRLFEEAAGGMGRRMIAKRLNAEGVRPWGRGAGWHDSYVAKILANRAAIGFCQPHRRTSGGRVADGPEIRDHFPSVIGEDLFWRAQAARSDRRGHGGRKGKGLSNLLSRVAFCASCGRPMRHLDKGPPPRGGRYLICDSALRSLPCPTPSRWRYDRAEAAVLGGVRRLDLGIVLGHADPSTALADRASSLRTQLEAAKGKRDRLLEALGDITDEAVIALVRQAAAEVSRLGVEARAAEEEAAQAAISHRDLPNRIALLAELESAQAAAEDPTEIRVRLAQEIRKIVRRLRFTPTNILADYGVAPGSSPLAWTIGVPLIQTSADAAEWAREAEVTEDTPRWSETVDSRRERAVK